MHELDSGIAKWRQTLAEQIGPDANVLDELESHLREEIDRLVRAGQAPADALTVAIAKIGAPEALAAQFAKLSTPWWPIYFVGGGAALAETAFLAMIGFSSADRLMRVHIGALSAGYLLTYAIGVLSLCWAIRTLFGELPIGQRSATVRALVWMSVVALVLTLIGILTGAAWASEHLGRFWDWDLRETGALLTIAWQAVLLVSLLQFPMKRRWLMSWGMLGKVTIILAWFVAGTVALQGFSATPAQILVLAVLTTHFGFYLLLVSGLIAVTISRARRLNPT